MSTTYGTTEPIPGAVPQPPPPVIEGWPVDRAGSAARSGDTDVVFRLERDVPLVHRLRELGAAAVDRLFESWRMVAAGGLVLLALGALAVTVGGAYGHRPPPAPPAAVPSPVPTPAALPVPAAARVEASAPAPSASRPARVRVHPARAHAGAKRGPGVTRARPRMPSTHRPH
jgi:hypothetical protein